MLSGLHIELRKLAMHHKAFANKSKHDNKAQRIQRALSRVDRMYSSRSAADRARMKKRRLDNIEGFFR